ncbi:amidohydrolase [uncultured Ruegeria sp.]|uniref:amidohydrolase n=1 Tax=uncultured Ruegeria sp. TaxID=259304 RepID=UPI00262C3775|nr:amidohydrolase [uncultured Ruegeria sp.]
MGVTTGLKDTIAQATVWRRHLHQHPELEFDTVETAAFVAGQLKIFGCDRVEVGIGINGVVAEIHGRPSNRSIGLRADMDALPITEATGLPHASQHPGKMHACGHDGHTSILLAAAKKLAENRNFSGKVVLIFQPAEETGGGAKAMMDDGLFDRFAMDEVFGMHNTPQLAIGSFAICPGVYAASSDLFDVTVTGNNSHAASPFRGTDPLMAATAIVTGFQTVISRSVSAIQPAVISVTAIRSDLDSYNTIPTNIHMKGTVRCLNADVRDQIEERMHQIVELVAASYGAVGTLDYRRNYPILKNDIALSEVAACVAEQVGPVNRALDRSMGTEDFAFFSEVKQTAYICFGNGDSARLHHPEYDFDDDAIGPALNYVLNLVQNRLGTKAEIA